MTTRSKWAGGLTILACLTFSAGLVFPLLSVHPGAGRWTPVLKIFASGEFESRSFTLPGSITLLWNGGEVFLAVLLGLFSLILPVAKLSVLWWEIIATDTLPTRFLAFFRMASRYAMVEVFLVALTVLLVKGMPGGSEVHLGPGTHAFAASVILSLVASRLAEVKLAG